MSAANPFAIAVEALGERFERLLDVRRDALHVAEIYSENKAVVEGQAVIAADALERLHDTRAALAVFERLAAVKVSNEVVDAILAKQNFPPHLWYVKTQNVGDDAPVLVEREVAYILAACLECRRRNEAQP